MSSCRGKKGWTLVSAAGRGDCEGEEFAIVSRVEGEKSQVGGVSGGLGVVGGDE